MKELNVKKSRRPKSPAKILIVRMDGETIQSSNSTETFIETVRRIGPERVANLRNIRIEGLPLVVERKDYRMQMSKLDNNWFICTHMPTIAQKRLLEKLCDILCIEIEVNVQ